MTSDTSSDPQAAKPGSGPDSGAGYGNNGENDKAVGTEAADDTATGGLEGEGSDQEAVLGGTSSPEGGNNRAGGGSAGLGDSEAGPGATIPGNEVTGKTA